MFKPMSSTHEINIWLEFESDMLIDVVLSGNSEDGYELKPVDIEEAVRRFVAQNVTPKFIKAIEYQLQVKESEPKEIKAMLAEEESAAAGYKAGIKYD